MLVGLKFSRLEMMTGFVGRPEVFITLNDDRPGMLVGLKFLSL